MSRRIIFWMFCTGALIGLCAAVFFLVKRHEERLLYARFSSVLTPEASARYNELPLFRRLATAHHVLPAVENLRKTGWALSATGLQPAPGEEGLDELVYKLGVGDSELVHCTVPNPFAEPAGSCESFTHALPREFNDGSQKGALPVRSQSVPLDLYLGEKPHAASRGTVRLVLGAASNVQAEGRVTLDDRDVRVSEAVVFVPNPILPKEKLDPVNITEFSLRTALSLHTVNRYMFDATYDMPAALAPFFDDAKQLSVLRAEAVVQVDLLRAGYHLEGELTVLNHKVGKGMIEYYPGQYASFSAADLSIPAALPGVCFEIKSAVLELDFERKRLRLAGFSEIQTVDSFLCKEGSVARDMGFLTRTALGFSLDAARSWLNLPETMETSGQLVVDLGDSIVCADMAVNGHSLLHAAYLGNTKTFQMWAPKGFATHDVSGQRFLGSAWDLLSDSWSAEWAFPESDPKRCWDGDQGPRTDMQFRLLSGSTKPETVAEGAL